MSVLLEPKKTLEEFKIWFDNEPSWHKIQLENVTQRDTSNSKVTKSIIGNFSKITDVYNYWYLPRWIGENPSNFQASERDLSQKQRIRVALALAKARARMRARNQ